MYHFVNYLTEHKIIIGNSISSLLLMSMGWINNLEIWLRIGSLVAGIILALGTSHKVWLDIKLKRKLLKKEQEKES
jgi:hypothetical protein